MAETQAAPSPAEVEDPFNGQTPTLTEYNGYRQSGEVPERFKPESADPAPAPAEGDEPENAPPAAAEDDQEPPEGIGNKARRRFEKLLAEKKELERRLAQTVKPETQTAPPAAPQPAQREKPTIQDKKPDGTAKYTTYEEFVEDLADWKTEQRLETSRQRDIQQKRTEQIQENIETARKRYGDEFDAVIEPTAKAINEDKAIPFEVKKMMADSDVLPELLFTLGDDEKTMKELGRLARVNPSQAIRYIATLEVGIREELAEKPDDKVTPEPRKTAAPKPPSPVSGPSSRAFDVSDESLSADEWARRRNAQVARRGQP